MPSESTHPSPEAVEPPLPMTPPDSMPVPSSLPATISPGAKAGQWLLGLVAAAGLLAVAGFVFLRGLVAPMGLDACFEESTNYFCRHEGAVMLFLIPAGAAPVLAVISIILAVAIRGYRVWMLVGGYIAVLAVLAAEMIMLTGF